MDKNDFKEQTLTTTKERAKFFQTVQAWPLDRDLNYDGWLNNFKNKDDRYIACLMLDFFTYYSATMVDQMLINSVSKSGYFFSKHFSDWQHSDYKCRCIYTFIPGENPNPTDSGNLFTRKLRDKLRVPEALIKNYSDIYSILKNRNTPTPIIFVDDFVGSGNQVRKAWSENRFADNKTLKDICLEGNHCAVYTPLVVNITGYKVIKNSCHGLNLCATHILGDEYNLFHQDCICWNNDSKLYNAGVELILRKSRELRIPSTQGHDVRDEKGFGMQGLALAFEHGAPDAIPAFFYWQTKNWIPLIQKHYER